VYYGQSLAGLRKTIRLVMALSLGYFGVEFAVALAIGSVSLLADGIDFLEDASGGVPSPGHGWACCSAAFCSFPASPRSEMPGRSSTCP
jgi:hypothetical protein